MSAHRGIKAKAGKRLKPASPSDVSIVEIAQTDDVENLCSIHAEQKEEIMVPQLVVMESIPAAAISTPRSGAI